MKKKKQSNGKYTINIRKLFRDTCICQFRREKDDDGKPTNWSPFDEIMDFAINDLKDAFLSIESIAKEHGRSSVYPEDVVEYYGYLGRPKMYEE